MVLLACVGLSMTFTTMGLIEKADTGQKADIGPGLAMTYLRCLLSNFISIFLVATFWLMYLIDPLRWIKMKIVVSMMVTFWTAADIIFGFIILLNVNKSDVIDGDTIQDNRVKLFVITILSFSSSCFFSRMAFMIDKKRREGCFNVNLNGNGETGSLLSHGTIPGAHSNLNIPGISDKPPKYGDLELQCVLPSYSEVTEQ